MLLPFTTGVLLVGLLLARVLDGRRSPLLVALAAWAFGVTIVALPIFDYAIEEPFNGP